MSILDQLNTEQRQAVETTEGPLLIVAGAGSGKTRAITSRIIYLMEEKKISPYHILAVTFTNKAAAEMRERVGEHLHQEVVDPLLEQFNEVFGLDNQQAIKQAPLPLMTTFHSLCVRILRAEADGEKLPFDRNFTIYDAGDQKTLIKRLIKEAGLDPDEFKPPVLLSQISNAKESLVDAKAYAQQAGSEYFYQKVAEVYSRYESAKLSANALDFDDLLYHTVQLFQNYPEVLDKYQERFRYIMVDEYQDTNSVQYELIRLLAEKYRNIAVVGDDDQSIYSWRGANIANILSFQKQYPEATVIRLEQNYRSTQAILDTAWYIISHNEARMEKKLWTDEAGGDPVKVLATWDERDEAREIARRIMTSTGSGEYCHRDIAILYRTNAQSRALEEGMMRFNIPYRIIGGVRFYERKEIKDLLAYANLIVNPRDEVALRRIINVPTRKIGATTIEKLSSYAAEHQLSLLEAASSADDVPVTPQARVALGDFAEMIKELQELAAECTAAEVLKQIYIRSRYDQMLDTGTVEDESRAENIKELIASAGRYDTVDPPDSLPAFLQEIALIADTDQLTDSDDTVTLMTIHAAKGLEYPVVYIAGCEEELLPHANSLDDPAALAEERRLMYVALTRAKYRAIITYAQGRNLFGNYSTRTPSRFLGEVPDGVLVGDIEVDPQPTYTMSDDDFSQDPDDYQVDYNIGQRVEHATYGAGEIVEISGDLLVIQLDTGERRKFVGRLTPLQKI